MRVLIFNDRWCSGGVESLWANIIMFYSKESDVQFEILAGEKETDIYDDFLLKKGITLMTVNEHVGNGMFKRKFSIIKKLKGKLKEINSDIIHINTCNGLGFYFARIAKKSGAKKVIVHSHNTDIEKNFLGIKNIIHKLCRSLFAKYADFNVACSHMAGKFMFANRPFYQLNNGINLARFKYNEEDRKKLRNQLDISNDAQIICSIGRISSQKNPFLLLRIFQELLKIDEKSRLIMVGSGPLFAKVTDYINNNNLSNVIFIFSEIKEVEKIISASDIFIMTSLHEGLPIVSIEAQANGIKCYFSDKITKECGLLPETEFFSLDEDLSNIARKITRKTNRNTDAQQILENCKYSIIDTARTLDGIYHDLEKEI